MKDHHILISFDLDFTLIDNTEGILNSFRYAFKKYHLPNLDDDTLKKTIGRPLEQVFKENTNLEPKILVKAFRDYYKNKGMFQVDLLDGVIQKLKVFRNTGILLGIVTSKKQEIAIDLLKYLKIFQYFDFVIGETALIKKKTDKEVKQFFLSKYPHSSYIIVGDHLTDRALAEMLECPFIGVLTGNTTEDELKNNATVPIFIFNHISELTKEDILFITDNIEK
ncbi:MAG: putative IndB protein [Promethearchaeota archaeon]|nr:MAG: putative IndB protein [Candidatus Lokiarchaeota archaeon]